MISKRYRVYKNFGKCLEIGNGRVKAVITVDVGPRVIFYGFKGKNMFKEDTEREVVKGGAFFDDNFREGEEWRMYGGHRIWKSEEDLYSYVPDNYPVRVERFPEGALFEQPVQRLTGLCQTLRVSMDEDGRLTLEENLTNVSDSEVSLSVWGLTAMRCGGTEIIPLNCEDTGLLPQRNEVHWSYNDRRDRRFSENVRYAVLKQRRNVERPFKIGFYNNRGWAAYHLGKTLFVKRFEVLPGAFPDFRCNYETYVNDKFLEMEVLSPVRTLSPGETASLTEVFELYDGVSFGGWTDDAIDAALEGMDFNG